MCVVCMWCVVSLEIEDDIERNEMDTTMNKDVTHFAHLNNEWDDSRLCNILSL